MRGWLRQNRVALVVFGFVVFAMVVLSLRFEHQQRELRRTQQVATENQRLIRRNAQTEADALRATCESRNTNVRIFNRSLDDAARRAADQAPTPEAAASIMKRAAGFHLIYDDCTVYVPPPLRQPNDD